MKEREGKSSTETLFVNVFSRTKRQVYIDETKLWTMSVKFDDQAKLKFTST